MHENRERIDTRDLESERQNRPAEGSITEHQVAEPADDRSETASTTGLSDSEQAQANLERMLETGEENPIS